MTLDSLFILFAQLKQFRNPPQILKGVEPFGRFGTAIESLGDINVDTFPGKLRMRINGFHYLNSAHYVMIFWRIYYKL